MALKYLRIDGDAKLSLVVDNGNLVDHYDSQNKCHFYNGSNDNKVCALVTVKTTLYKNNDVDRLMKPLRIYFTKNNVQKTLVQHNSCIEFSQRNGSTCFRIINQSSDIQIFGSRGYYVNNVEKVSGSKFYGVYNVKTYGKNEWTRHNHIGSVKDREIHLWTEDNFYIDTRDGDYSNWTYLNVRYGYQNFGGDGSDGIDLGIISSRGAFTVWTGSKTSANAYYSREGHIHIGGGSDHTHRHTFYDPDSSGMYNTLGYDCLKDDWLSDHTTKGNIEYFFAVSYRRSDNLAPVFFQQHSSDYSKYYIHTSSKGDISIYFNKNVGKFSTIDEIGNYNLGEEKRLTLATF